MVNPALVPRRCHPPTVAEMVCRRNICCPIGLLPKRRYCFNLQGSFFLVCKICFETSRRLIIKRADSDAYNCSACCQTRTVVLVHISAVTDESVAIGQRRFTQSNAFYNICYQQQTCQRRESCVHAHSAVERDVWYLQRDYDYSFQQIADEVSLCLYYLQLYSSFNDSRKQERPAVAREDALEPIQFLLQY